VEHLQQLLVIQRRLQLREFAHTHALLLQALHLLPITAEQLVHTQLGSTVMQLAQGGGQTPVKRLARQLVTKWRATVTEEAHQVRRRLVLRGWEDWGLL
jgi:hypothetical protein